MKILIFSPFPKTLDIDIVVLPYFTGEAFSKSIHPLVSSETELMLRNLLKTGEITGKEGETTILHRFHETNIKRFLVLGMGKKSDLNYEKLIGFISNALTPLYKKNFKVFAFYSGGLKGIVSDFKIASSINEAFIYSLYSFDKYKTTQKTIKTDKLLLGLIPHSGASLNELKKGIKFGEIIGNSVQKARVLAEEPPNFLTPSNFAILARNLAKRTVLECSVLDEKKMQELGMRLTLSVSKGSEKPAVMIILKYKGAPSENDAITFLGKGVTFDSGGISLKRTNHIYEMKRDMYGGALVFAAMEAIALLKPNVNVTGVIISSENMIGENAYKPGDIVKSMLGKTVEIFSTDAEGRLLLADALTYIQRFLSPSVIIDIATLTAATMSSLGPRITPYLTNMPWLSDIVKKAILKSGETFWEIPLTNEYEERVHSHFADLKNNSPRPPYTIASALFLNQFIQKDQPWLHIDVASVDTNDKPYYFFPTGATGIGVKTLIELIRTISISQIPTKQLSEIAHQN